MLGEAIRVFLKRGIDFVLGKRHEKAAPPKTAPSSASGKESDFGLMTEAIKE